MASRYCPLCDLPTEGPQCPVHWVPTILLEGPRGPLEHLEIGTVLVGRYRIEGLLQQGGMGVLLRATRQDDQRPVVIKVLKGRRIHDLHNVRRFYQEARVASALDHPNIVRIIEFGVDQSTHAPFLVMERIPGRTLKALVAREGPLTERRTVTLFAQIAQALLAAHNQGILHRDLKPSNVMISTPDESTEVVKVLDFGLAKVLDDESVAPLTLPGKTVGTPAFMSPEQVTQRPQDHRSDLYSLGCVLYTVLTGQAPYPAQDLITVMRMQIRQPSPRLPEKLVDGQAPSDGLITLYRALVKKDPKERPRSTEVVVRAFDALGERCAGIPEAFPRIQTAQQVAAASTLIEPLAAADTDSSAEPVARELPCIPSDSDMTQLNAISGSSDDLKTTPDTRGISDIVETDMGLAVVDIADLDDAETPIVIDGIALSSAAESFDELLTTVVPQGLDEPSATPTGISTEGPIFGASLLVPRPWPEDAKDTRPLKTAYAAPVAVGAPKSTALDPAESQENKVTETATPRYRTRQFLIGAALVTALATGLVIAATLRSEPTQAPLLIPPVPERPPRGCPPRPTTTLATGNSTRERSRRGKGCH